MAEKAKISDIFKSIQGEGLYQGEEQLFVRLYGCNLQCKYCDTRLDYYEEKTVDELISLLDSDAFSGVQSVALTGGEPLLQPEFIKVLCQHPY